MSELATKAERLRELHYGEQVLFLPNAWDAASAATVVDAGYPVVATTSNAIAESLGYPDGEGAPASEMFHVARRIAASVPVPVTVDAEAGYGLTADTLVEQLVDAGAVGCNIEDTDHRRGGLLAAEERAEYIAQMRAASQRIGVPLVINARTDVFLAGSQIPSGDRLTEAIRRGRLYRRAGADCVYPIGAGHDQLATLTGEIDAPINAGLRRGDASLADLRKIGVARVSLGPQLYRAALRQLRTDLSDLAQS